MERTRSRGRALRSKRRGSRLAKPTGEGTGLGLSISYDIVTQLHGGSISVESEDGVYTEFTVRLPRVSIQAHWRKAMSVLVSMTSPTALLFRQQFRREICDGTYVMHIANSGDGLRAVE